MSGSEENQNKKKSGYASHKISMLRSLQKIVISLKIGSHDFLDHLKTLDSRLRGNDVTAKSRERTCVSFPRRRESILFK
jgi:hypothetical protein